MKADVLVLGAGSAGLAAAATAARQGARVLLLERHGYAGGMGTASLVHTFCGLYLPGGGQAVLANPGFPAEMAERMLQATGAAGPVKMGRVWVLMQHPVEFVRIADEILSVQPNDDAVVTARPARVEVEEEPAEGEGEEPADVPASKVSDDDKKDE